MAERKIGKASNDPWDVLGLPNPLRPKPKAGPPAPQQSQLERVGVKVPPVQAKPAPKPKVSAPKTKQIPWEERSTYNGFRKLIQDLPTVDPTLLDSYLYIQRESGGKKIDPFVPKGMAGGYKVPQQAFNQARALARTPEGQAQMRAEVEAFRAQRRQLAPMVRQQAQQLSPEITAPLAPKRQGPAPLVAGTPLPADEKSRILAEQRARMDEQSFRTGTDRGRAVTSIKDAEKQLSQLLSPVTGPLAAAIARTSPVLAATGQTQGAESALRELPGQLTLGIPTGLNDLLTVLDSDTGLRPEQKIPFVLGAIANLGGAGVGAATLSSDVAKAGAAIARARMTLQGAKPGPAVKAAERGLANMAENVRAGRVTPEQAQALEAAFPARPTPRVPSVTPPPTGAARLGPEPAVQSQQAVKAAETPVQPVKAPEVPVTPTKPVQVPEVQAAPEVQHYYRTSLRPPSDTSVPPGYSIVKLGDAGDSYISYNSPLSPEDVSRLGLAPVSKQVAEAGNFSRPRWGDFKASFPDIELPASLSENDVVRLTTLYNNGSAVSGQKSSRAQSLIDGLTQAVKMQQEASDVNNIIPRKHPLKGEAESLFGNGWHRRGVADIANELRKLIPSEEVNKIIQSAMDGARVTSVEDAERILGDIVASRNAKIAAASRLAKKSRTKPPTAPVEVAKAQNVIPEQSSEIKLTQIGDFYEAYGDQAKLLSKELEIPLMTTRDGKTSMSAIPKFSLERFSKQLEGKGIKLSAAADVPAPKPKAATRADRLKTELKTASPTRAEEIQSDLKALGMQEAADKRKATGTMTPKQAEEAERQANKVVPGVRVNTPEGPGKAVSYPVYSKVRVELDAGGSKRFDRADVTRAVDEAPAPKPKSVKPQKALDTVPDVKSSQYPDDAELNTIGSATIVKKFPGVFESADEKVRTLPSWSTVDALVNKAAIRAGKTYGADRASAVRLIAAHQYLDNLGMAERYLSAADVEKLGKATTRLRKEFGLPPGARADGWELVRMARDAAPSAPKPTDTPTWAGKVTEKADARLAELEAIRAKKGRRIEGKQKGVVNIGPEDFEYVAWQAIKTAAQTLEPIEKVIRGLAKAERFTESEIEETIKVARGIGKAEGIPDEAFGVAAKAKPEPVTGAARKFTDAERIAEGKETLKTHGVDVNDLVKKGVESYTKKGPLGVEARVEELARYDDMSFREARNSKIAPPTEAEIYEFAAHKAELKKLRAEALSAMKSAANETDRASAAAQYEKFTTQQEIVDKALNAGSGTFHKIGMALQTAFQKDYDVVSLVDAATAANKGQKLSKGQEEVVTGVAETIATTTSDADRLSKKLESLPADVVLGDSPEATRVYNNWMEAHKGLYAQKAYLRKLKRDTSGATRAIAREEAKVKALEAKLKEAESRLDEVLARKGSVRSDLDSAKAQLRREEKSTQLRVATTRQVTRESVRSQNDRANAMLKRIGVYKGKTAPLPVTGGKNASKQSGFFNLSTLLPEERANLASAIRLKIRASVDEAILDIRDGTRDMMPDLDEVLTKLTNDPDLDLNRDQILGILATPHREAILEADVAKAQADQIVAIIRRKAEWDALEKHQKAWEFVKDIGLTVPRAVTFSVDAGSLFLQSGKALSSGHVDLWLQSIPELVKGYRSEEDALRSWAKIQSDPLYAKAKKAGLDLSDTNKEEMFTGDMIDNIYKSRFGKIVAPVRASSRGMGAQLNSIRFGLYKRMVEDGERMAVGSSTDPNFLKDMAAHVNVITGRGNIKPRNKDAFNKAAQFLIAPRLYFSGIQDAIAQPFWQALGSGNRLNPGKLNAQTKLIAREYMKRVATYAATFGVMKALGWEFDTDPRSNSYGQFYNTKIVPGETRYYNMFGRSAEWFTPVIQMRYGTVSKQGKFLSPNAPGFGGWQPFISKLLNKTVPGIRNVGAAFTGSIYDFRKNETVQYGPMEAAKSFMPIIVQSAVDAVMSRDAKEADVTLLQSLGIQVGGGKPKVPTTTQLDWRKGAWEQKQETEARKKAKSGKPKEESVVDIIRRQS